METVYFIYSRGMVHIPMLRFSKELLTRIQNCKFAWDESKKQFTSSAEYVTNAMRAHLFYDIISVQIDEDCGNMKINGFFSNVWEKKPLSTDGKNNIMPEKTENPKNTDFSSDPLFESLKTELNSRKYSLKTIKTYLFYNIDLCKTVKKSPNDIEHSDVKVYLAGLEQKNHSAASMNLAVSSFKFFYGVVLHRYFVNEQRRPKQDKRLPEVLAQSEISTLLASVKNLKHKLLLMLAYSSGLRVSELVALRIEDIDFERKTIYLKNAKGRKDRYTILGEAAAKSIKEYCATFAIKSGWLFTSWSFDKHLTIRTAQKIFDSALEKAKITKNATLHSLRHSFATHLLENGTDISFIKKLLGHSSIRTTERYAHVAKKDVLSVPSPLDAIYKSMY